MPDPETANPEPTPSIVVPSVNPETPPITDNESQDTQWIDPMFEDQDAPLSDEIVEAGGEEAEQAETKGPGPSAEQLAKLVAEDTEIVEKPAQPAEQAEKEPADGDGSDAGSKAAEGGDAGSGTTDSPEADEVKARTARRIRREQKREEDNQKLTSENAELNRRLTALEQGEAPAEQAEAVPAEPPTLEDHDFDTDKWAAAMGDWTKATVSEAENKVVKAREEEATKAAAARHAETMETFGSREKDARGRHEDYDDVVYDETIIIEPRAAQAIWQSEQGPEIAYYLATHQDEAKAMAKMSEMDLGRALAKIEYTLTAEQAAPAEQAPETPAITAAEQAPADNEPARQVKPAPSPTKAPPPVPNLGGSGAAMRPSVESMGMDEYAAGRRSGKIR